MDGASTFFSSLDSDFSTGYLEDALIEFGVRSKRRRLLLYTDDGQATIDLSKGYWNANLDRKLSENFSYMSQMTDGNIVSDEPPRSTSMGCMSEEAPETLDSSTSFYKYSAKTKLITCDKEMELSQDNKARAGGHKRKDTLITRVVYPFALIKPGGAEGDMTINDINERILMPPTRPVRHPVGDFACRPCVSADGPGLSGKAVVALARIHTQGRGTITIIRTKGSRLE